MKIALVAGNEKLLKELKRTIASQDHTVEETLVRAPGDGLAPVLKSVDGDALIIDGSCDSADDLAAIEAHVRAHPAAAVLMLSPRRQSESLIAAMRAGVREVLHSPPAAADLIAALKRIEQRHPGDSGPAGGGRILAFISCKGGSGATFLATNLGYTLAVDRKKKVLFIDLDLQYGDASYFVSDRPGKLSVADLAKQVERLDGKLLASSMITVAPRYGVISAPEEPEAALDITAQQIERLLDVARASYDFVIVDLERALDAIAIKVLDKADLIYPVMEQMVPFIRDAKRMVKAFLGLAYPKEKIHLIVNRYQRRGDISLVDLEETVGLKVYRTVPNDFSQVAESVNLGMPLMKTSPNSAVARAIRDIAGDLTQTGKQQHGWFGRLRSTS